jgi:hypothetical protein
MRGEATCFPVHKTPNVAQLLTRPSMGLALLSFSLSCPPHFLSPSVRPSRTPTRQTNKAKICCDKTSSSGWKEGGRAGTFIEKTIDISPCNMQKIHVTLVDVRGDEVPLPIPHIVLCLVLQRRALHYVICSHILIL